MTTAISSRTYQRGALGRPYSRKLYVGAYLLPEGVARTAAHRAQRSNPAVKVRTVRVEDTGSYVNVLYMRDGGVR